MHYCNCVPFFLLKYTVYMNYKISIKLHSLQMNFSSNGKKAPLAQYNSSNLYQNVDDVRVSIYESDE